MIDLLPTVRSGFLLCDAEPIRRIQSPVAAAIGSGRRDPFVSPMNSPVWELQTTNADAGEIPGLRAGEVWPPGRSDAVAFNGTEPQLPLAGDDGRVGGLGGSPARSRPG